MNRQQAEKHAEYLVRRKLTAYAGQISTANALDMQLTNTAYAKVKFAFLSLVMDSPDYPAVEQLYAESELRHMATRRKRDELSADT